jgi:hypothetical protein
MKHTVKEKKHMDKIARLGCIICRKQGHMFVDAELHHIRDMTGMGKRSSHFEVIPLCVAHHRLGKEAFHHSKKEFEAKWGTQRELLKEVLKLAECCGGLCEDCNEI